MAWQDTLLDASWRGVPFDVEVIQDVLEWSVAQAEYPYLDGGELEDLGRRAQRIELTAIWFGPDYEQRVQQFLRAASTPGSAELIHPVLGSIRARLVSAQLSHEADSVDSCRAQLVFLEDALGKPLFDRTLAAQKAEQVESVATRLDERAAERFSLDVGRLTQIKDVAARLEQFRDAALGQLTRLARQVNSIIYSGMDVIDFPQGFVADLRSVLDSIAWPHLSSGDPDNLTPEVASERLDAFMATRSNLAACNPVADSATAASPPVDQPITRLLQLSVATTLARVAADCLAAELAQPLLSPGQVEQVSNAARMPLQGVIQQLRQSLPLEQARPLVEACRQLAWQVQEAARAVILLRPPLLTRTVEAEGSLVLIAHRWYGDYRRATELLRLNPSLRQPNFIPAGARLHAYAR